MRSQCSHPIPASSRPGFFGGSVTLLIAAMAAGGWGVFAQGPSPEPVKTPIPQLHADTPEIVVDLVARDKRNRPVVNLTASDVAVTDGAAQVQLEDLHLVTQQSGARTQIALLFDNMSPEAAKSAHDFAARLLAEAPQQTEFAVFGVDRGLRLLETYSTDRARLKAAMMLAPDKIPAASLSDAEKAMISVLRNGAFPDGKHASVEDRAKAKLMMAALEGSQKIVAEQRFMSSLAGILAIARVERGLPGHHIVLFFSEGIRATSITQEQSKDVVEAANRGGLAIYTVDAMGVAIKSFDVLTMMYQPGHQLAARNSPSVTGMWHGSLEGNITQVAGIQNNATGANHLQQDSENANSLLAFLADGTGGFSVSTGDDPRRPLKRLLSDVDSYYEALYTPALKQYDGSFHSLDVRALRAGITIRARSGYFAVAPDEEGLGPVRASEAPLVKLLADAAPADGIAFDQAVLEVADNAQGRVTDEFAVEVPVSHLSLRSDEQTKLYSVRASILSEVKDTSGVVVQRFQQDVARNGALESIGAARTGSVTLQRQFEAPPGNYTVETAVLDQISGKTGIQRTRFTVPAAQSGPWLSDVVLMQRTQPLGGAPDSLEPLVYEHARVVPSVDHRVPAGTQPVVFLVRVKGDPAAGNGALAFDVDREGKSVTHSLSKIAAAANGASSLNVASIDATNLTAGTYQAAFTLTEGAKTQTRSLTFTVEGNPGDKPGAPDYSDEDTEDYPVDVSAMSAGKFQPGLDLAAPSQSTQTALLDGARERANGFLVSLMDFECLEITDRYVDHRGNGKAHHDRIVELLASENHKESRRVLQVNGQPADSDSVDMSGARLEGAFGGVLQIVFQADSDAHFEWKQNGFLDGSAVDVFSYSVDQKHSHFSVTSLPAPSILVPFHGMVFIDAATHGVRRITMEGDDIPAHSPIHASALSIDYDYVTMNDHDYLVPVRGEMRMQIGKAEKILHTIEFRNYHRFGSKVRILNENP